MKNELMIDIETTGQNPGYKYSVSFPDLDGCFTQGDTLEEALAMANEAMELTLEDVFDGDPLPECKTKANEKKGLYRIDVAPELAIALQVAAARGKVPQATVACAR